MNEKESQLLELFMDKLNALSMMGDSAFITSKHFDQLEVYVNAKPSLFPEKVVNLVKNPGTSTGGRHRTIERIFAIFEAIENLPAGIELNEAQNTDALIPTFVLNENDRLRISDLCEKMRKIIFSTQEFDESHRVRLLNRLAASEAEIHKPKGKFDVVRGGINDLGETLGKFGKDIKPLTD